MGKKRSVGQVKKERGIVSHEILLARVVEGRGVQEELSLMNCADAE